MNQPVFDHDIEAGGGIVLCGGCTRIMRDGHCTWCHGGVPGFPIDRLDAEGWGLVIEGNVKSFDGNVKR